MKKKTDKVNTPAKKETKTDLRKEATANKGVKKGYNEKNPEQPQGAFKPDNASTDN